MATTAVPVKRVQMGSQGMEVSSLGLGCATLSSTGYNNPHPDEGGMIKLIHHAVSMGVTFLDTADVYGSGTSEIFVGKTIKGIRDKVQIATKFGISFHPSGKGVGVQNMFELLVNRRIHYQHRVDSSVPIEATVGEMKKLVEEGKVKYIGL